MKNRLLLFVIVGVIGSLSAIAADPSSNRVRSAGPVSIVDYGACSNGSKATAAFAAAIDAVHRAGGGRVMVPAGEWLTGAIHLKSNVELHLDDCAKIVFTDEPEDYLPSVRTSYSCIECYNYSPLVYAFGCTNVAVTGGGTLVARMERWRRWCNRDSPAMLAVQEALYRWGENDEPVENRRLNELPGATCRPNFVEFVSCRNVRLQGFRIRESPCWTIHVRLCEDVHVDGLDVAAFGNNNDGIDIDASRRVLVENSRFAQGDDGIVIKSGRDRDGRRVGVPAEDVEIRNCTLLSGHALLAVGSEVSGGVRNVFLHDCRSEGVVQYLIRIKTSDRKGAFVEGVVVSNVVANVACRAIVNVSTGIDYQWKRYPARERLLTRIDGFHISNVRCEEAGAFYSLVGDARLPARSVTLRDVSVGKVIPSPYPEASPSPFFATNVIGLVCESVRVDPDSDGRAKSFRRHVTNFDKMAKMPPAKGVALSVGECTEDRLAQLSRQDFTFVRCSFDAGERDQSAIAALLDAARRQGLKVALHLRGTPEDWLATVGWLHYRNTERAQALFAYDLLDQDEAGALDASALRERQQRLLVAIRSADGETPVFVDHADLPFRMNNVIYKKRLSADGIGAIVEFQRRYGCRICLCGDNAGFDLPARQMWDSLKAFDIGMDTLTAN